MTTPSYQAFCEAIRDEHGRHLGWQMFYLPSTQFQFEDPNPPSPMEHLKQVIHKKTHSKDEFAKWIRSPGGRCN